MDTSETRSQHRKGLSALKRPRAWAIGLGVAGIATGVLSFAELPLLAVHLPILGWVGVGSHGDTCNGSDEAAVGVTMEIVSSRGTKKGEELDTRLTLENNSGSKLMTIYRVSLLGPRDPLPWQAEAERAIVLEPNAARTLPVTVPAGLPDGSYKLEAVVAWVSPDTVEEESGTSSTSSYVQIENGRIDIIDLETYFENTEALAVASTKGEAL